MRQCPKCGGLLIGDGYSDPVRCEFTDPENYAYAAPDEGPFYCDYNEEERCYEDE